jgi:hypothetical protein
VEDREEREREEGTGEGTVRRDGRGEQNWT